MTPRTCECGRHVRVRQSVKAKSGRRARAGAPVRLKEHYMCQKCWEQQCDKERSVALTEKRQ